MKPSILVVLLRQKFSSLFGKKRRKFSSLARLLVSSNVLNFIFFVHVLNFIFMFKLWSIFDKKLRMSNFIRLATLIFSSWVIIIEDILRSEFKSCEILKHLYIYNPWNGSIFTWLKIEYPMEIVFFATLSLQKKR